MKDSLVVITVLASGIYHGPKAADQSFQVWSLLL